MNFYEGKQLVIVNIENTVRCSISGKTFIVAPDDVGVYVGIRPILRKVREQGYVLVGVSHQPGIAEHAFDPYDYLNGIKKMNTILYPDSVFDRVYYTWDGKRNYYDTRIIFDAMSDAGVYRRRTLYVGYSALEIEMCKSLGISFVPASVFFNRVPHRMTV
jgi:histidinol phosphatase-like enzyme